MSGQGLRKIMRGRYHAARLFGHPRTILRAALKRMRFFKPPRRRVYYCGVQIDFSLAIAGEHGREGNGAEQKVAGRRDFCGRMFRPDLQAWRVAVPKLRGCAEGRNRRGRRSAAKLYDERKRLRESHEKFCKFPRDVRVARQYLGSPCPNLQAAVRAGAKCLRAAARSGAP